MGQHVHTDTVPPEVAPSRAAGARPLRSANRAVVPCGVGMDEVAVFGGNSGLDDFIVDDDAMAAMMEQVDQQEGRRHGVF